MADLSTPQPPYLRIAAELRAQITSGALKPASRLPTITALAQNYDVSTNTIQKALNVLKAEGLIEGVAGYGTFVTER